MEFDNGGRWLAVGKDGKLIKEVLRRDLPRIGGSLSSGLVEGRNEVWLQHLQGELRSMVGV